MSFNDRFHEISSEVRNWGRWGDDDRLGTLNLLTDEAVAHAASTIRSGRRVPMAIDLSPNGPQIGSIPGRVNPLRAMNYINNPDLGDPDGNAMVPHFNDDHVVMGLQAATHWDALGHVSYAGSLYNGVPANTVTALGGSTVLGIENVRTLVGRGVLLDVAAMRGVDQLPGGHEITSDELDETAAWAGVEMRPGDIVLIRTGRIRSFKDGGDVMTFEVFPGPEPENMLAVHCLAIVDMGLTTGQIWDLEALSVACAEEGRHTFFLAANPEPFVGGCGAPVSPVAVF